MRHNTFKSEVEIDYVLRKSTNKSNILVVSFPGAGGDRFRADSLGLGYMMTIGQFNVNALYIKSSREDFINAWFVGTEGDFSIERSIMELVEFACQETGSTHCVGIGSSLGGNTALYYGLKYNWDVIAGGARAPKSWYVGQLIHDMIPTALSRGFDKRIYMCWGRGEPMWRNKSEAPSLIKRFDDEKVPYTMELFKYSVHANISKVFPSIIRRELGKILGYEEQETLEEKEVSEAEIIGEITSSLKNLKIYADQLIDVKPNYSIKGCVNHGSLDHDANLKTFVYATHGYYWLPGRDKPLRADQGEFWKTIAPKSPQFANSFQHQTAILNFFKETKNAKAVAYLTEIILEFLNDPEAQKSTNRKHKRSWTSQLRNELLIDFACTLRGPDQEHSDEVKACLRKLEQKIDWEKIKIQIVSGLRRSIHSEILLSEVEENYSRLIYIAEIGEFFRDHVDFYNAVYEKVLEVAETITNYYFDENGHCIYEQTNGQHNAAPHLNRLLKFVERNNEKPGRKFRKLLKKMSAIENVRAHLIRDDGRTPNLGHSDRKKAIGPRSTGELLNIGSNIAVLSTDSEYITIGGGSNIHSPFRHCDLLSFTFRYDGRQLIWDAGGGTGELADYARSALAHSAFICDEADYVTPDYADWTVLDDAVSTDNYAFISGKHFLIEGVSMARKWLWLKPNVLIIYDEARSNKNHLYTQNFIAPKWKFREPTNGVVEFRDGKGCTFQISQAPRDTKFRTKTYFGTNKLSATEGELRGSRIDSFTRPRQMTNIAFEKHSSNCDFLTILQASTGRADEAKLINVEVTEGFLNIKASRNGKIIDISEKVEREGL